MVDRCAINIIKGSANDRYNTIYMTLNYDNDLKKRIKVYNIFKC